MAVPAALVCFIMLLTLPVIAAVVALETEPTTHSNTMKFWKPDANIVRTWRPLPGGFEERSIGSNCELFLLMSGDVMTNHGPPRTWKYPCGN